MQASYRKFWQFFLIYCCMFMSGALQAQIIPPSPPTDVHGHQAANRFASQTDLVNVITWKAPNSKSSPVAYQIYRNPDLTDLIANISANKKLKFKDHNRKKDALYTYYLVSVDAAGNKSTPIGIIFKGSKVIIEKNPLLSIQVTPIDPIVARDFTIQFTATGIFSDGTVKDLTNRVNWKSSNPRIASISNAKGSHGLAIGLRPGTSQISATLLGITGSTTLTVTAAKLVSIEVTPVNPIIAEEFTIQFTAMGLFNDGTMENLTNQVIWTSSLPTIASISNTAGSNGLATGLSPGTTLIEATSHGLIGSTTLTVTSATLVSIEVTPVDPILAEGFNLQFTAIGLFSDNTTENLTNQVTWRSSDPTVASISNEASSKGLATGINPGTSLIEATIYGVTGSTTLRVTSATLVSIEVTPVNPIVAEGFILRFTATGVFSDGTTENLTNEVTWSSSNPTVAFISNDSITKGVAFTLSPGISVIGAKSQGLIGSTTLTVTTATLISIEVTPIDPTIAEGFTIPFTATGLFSDNSTEDLTAEVTWNSSNPSVASISNDPSTIGLATGLSAGFTSIEASLHGITGSTILTVTEAALTSITVTPIDLTLAAGFTAQYTALGHYSDGTTEDLTNEVTWESSNQAVAFISNASDSKGLATALTPGTTTISAIFGSVSGTTSLTVTSAILQSIAVTPTDPSIADGFNVQFTATGFFSDSTTEDLTNEVTWTSSDQSVAMISNATGSKGLATTLSPGSTTISAMFAGVTGTTTLTVSSAILDSITVTPADATISAGVPTQFTATGHFSDGTNENLTNEVTWQSSNQNVAIVSNATGSQGVVTGVTSGGTTITATVKGVTGSTTLTVTCPTITFTTSSSLPQAFPSVAYNIQLETSGGVEPITFALVSGSLPNGLTLQSDGVISGIPEGPSCSCTFTASATSSCSSTTQKSFTIPYTCIQPVFTSPAGNVFPIGNVNETYINSDGSPIKVTADGTQFISFSADPAALPPGLRLETIGFLVGTPTQAGTFYFIIDATNPCDTTSGEFQLTIKP